MRAGELITKFSKTLLENRQQAMLYAAVTSVLPFASWLSVALILLVTLRKGAKAGFEVMLPALVIHSVPLMMLLPVDSALINTFFEYIPCYLAAICLRKTISWQWVCGIFLVQAILGFLLIQLIAPEFIIGQLTQFKKLLTHYQEYEQIIDSSFEGLTAFNLAQLFFGIQILSVVISAIISLLFVRSIQAKLFLPGAFREELLGFRAGKISLLVLLLIGTAAYYQIPLALNLLPMVCVYFLVAGFNLAYFVLARKHQYRIALLLFLLIMFKPSYMLLAYLAIGSLDSLFNFRLYLPVRVSEST